MLKKIQVIIRILGFILIIFAIIFLIAHTFIRVGSSSEEFSRDILGLAVPTPPVWISYIPYLGFVIGAIYEFFSLHGLVGLIIFSISLPAGIKLMNIGDLNKQQAGFDK